MYAQISRQSSPGCLTKRFLFFFYQQVKFWPIPKSLPQAFPSSHSLMWISSQSQQRQHSSGGDFFFLKTFQELNACQRCITDLIFVFVFSLGACLWILIPPFISKEDNIEKEHAQSAEASLIHGDNNCATGDGKILKFGDGQGTRDQCLLRSNTIPWYLISASLWLKLT